MLQLLVFNASMYLLGVYLCCTLIVNFHIFAVSSPSAVGSTTNQKTTTAVRTSHRGVLAKSLVVGDAQKNLSIGSRGKVSHLY